MGDPAGWEGGYFERNVSDPDKYIDFLHRYTKTPIFYKLRYFRGVGVSKINNRRNDRIFRYWLPIIVGGTYTSICEACDSNRLQSQNCCDFGIWWWSN